MANVYSFQGIVPVINLTALVHLDGAPDGTSPVAKVSYSAAPACAGLRFAAPRA